MVKKILIAIGLVVVKENISKVKPGWQIIVIIWLDPYKACSVPSSKRIMPFRWSVHLGLLVVGTRKYAT